MRFLSWTLPLVAIAGAWVVGSCGTTAPEGPPEGDDAGVAAGDDAGTAGDAGQAGPDAGAPDSGGAADGGGTGIGPTPSRGGVTNSGGTVDRLYFAVTGDTRPGFCDMTSSYPIAKITRIAQLIEARQVQFALDAGDHIYVCFAGLNAARTQMGYYMTAIANIKVPFFMSMGNHECTLAIGNCPTGSTDSNYLAYLEALQPVAARAYYSVDVKTSQGLAKFVIIADNSWDSAHQTWLENTLTEADTLARYTIVVRHHNLNAGFNNIKTIINRHKYALHITGHAHTYQRDTAQDPSGRTVIVGTGGAPSPQFYGYGTVIQGLDGRLYFTMYDEQTDAPVDSWNVGPNQ